MQTPRPDRIRFLDHCEDALQRIAALGLTEGQLAALRAEYGLLAADNVTGFHEGRSGPGRLSTLHRAIRHARLTGEECYYVEMDLRNLGGLNAALGHTGANEVYAAISSLVRSELSSFASESAFFRHGGDETSAFLIDTTEQAVRKAFVTIHQEAADLARSYKVHDVPHPKHPYDGRFSGTGVRFALVRLRPDHEDDPTLVFRQADADLERNKRTATPSNMACSETSRPTPAGSSSLTPYRSCSPHPAAAALSTSVQPTPWPLATEPQTLAPRPGHFCGVWIDEGFDARTKTVTVKAQSNAYFKILEKQPQVRDVFRLVHHLVWITPSGTALIVDCNSGKDELDDKDIDMLFVNK